MDTREDLKARWERKREREERERLCYSASVCLRYVVCVYTVEMIRVHSDSCRCLSRMPNGIWILSVRLEPREIPVSMQTAVPFYIQPDTLIWHHRLTCLLYDMQHLLHHSLIILSIILLKSSERIYWIKAFEILF